MTRLPGQVRVFHDGAAPAPLGCCRGRRSARFEGRNERRPAGRVSESLREDKVTKPGTKGPEGATPCSGASPSGRDRAQPAARGVGEPRQAEERGGVGGGGGARGGGPCAPPPPPPHLGLPGRACRAAPFIARYFGRAGPLGAAA